MRCWFVLCVAIVASGCGASGLPYENAAIKADLIKQHGADPITFVKWWPEVSADKAGLTELFAEVNKCAKSTDSEAASCMSFEIFSQRVTIANAEKLTRVRYRVPNAKGENELHDEIYFIESGPKITSWPSTDANSPSCVMRWERKHFPD